MDFLSKLRRANVERDKIWNPRNEISLSWRGNELAGEIGEACNILKKLDRERLGLKGSRSNPEKLAEELADGIICIDLAAMEFDIDLVKAVIDKFNSKSTEHDLGVYL